MSAWLALMAMFLLAFAPTISRTLAARHHGVGPAMAMGKTCHAAVEDSTPGLVSSGEGAAAGDAVAHHPVRGPYDAGDACGYCSMVMPLPVLLLLMCGLLLLPPVAPVFRFRAVLPHPLRNLRGLGGQGPPIPF